MGDDEEDLLGAISRNDNIENRLELPEELLVDSNFCGRGGEGGFSARSGGGEERSMSRESGLLRGMDQDLGDAIAVGHEKLPRAVREAAPRNERDSGNWR